MKGAARALLVVLAAGLGGCRSTEPGRERLAVAYVTNNASDFWTIARRGCEKADAELEHVEVEFRIPADGTAAEQRRIVDDLLSKGTRGIAISPVDPANQTAMINDAAAKTLVITHDSDAPATRRACYVGTDNVAAGRQAGELVREALPGGGKIVLFVGMADAQNARERTQGLREALAGTGIEILDVRTDDTDRVRAKTNVSDTLVRYPDIAGLVGLWSYNGPAIVNAVRDAGRIGRVRIVAFDEEDETLAGIRDGSIHGTVVQQPYEFGYQAVKLMASILRGDSSMVPSDKKIIVPTLMVRRDNVDAFTERIRKLRGRA